MRNIPVFSTDLGVASLVLDQIPYKQAAYVHIHDTAQPEEFIEECAQFCRAAGADRVYVASPAELEEYPVFTQVLQLVGSLQDIADTDAALMPVTERTLDAWRQIYNEKMAAVDDAAFMDAAAARQLLQEGHGYFVHREGKLLGIGKVAGDTIDVLAATEPGAGETVLQALCHALAGDRVIVRVASTNRRAMRLYERLGFICTGVLQTWYQIL